MNETQHGAAQLDWREFAATELRGRRENLRKCKEKIARKKEDLEQQIAGALRLIAKIDDDLEDLARSARVLQISLEENQAAAPVDRAETAEAEGDAALSELEDGQASQFKDTALAVLKTHFPGPVRAPDLQATVEARLGRKFHPKTAGMTLYRFSNKGLVRRDGREWFYVPQEVSERSHPGEEPSSTQHGTKEDDIER